MDVQVPQLVRFQHRMHNFYYYPRLKIRQDELQVAIKNNINVEHTPIIIEILPFLDGKHTFETIIGELLIKGFTLKSIFEIFDWLDKEEFIEDSKSLNILSNLERKLYGDQISLFAYIHSRGDNYNLNELRMGLEDQVILKKSLIIIFGIGRTVYQLIKTLNSAGATNMIIFIDRTDKVSEEKYTYLLSVLKSDNLQNNMKIISNLEEISENIFEKTPNLFIYCPDNFDEAKCKFLNDLCLINSIPFITYRQLLFDILIGPLVIPNETACYICYELRRKAITSNSDTSIKDNFPRQKFPIGIEIMVFDIIKFLTKTMEPFTKGYLWHLNITTGITELHPILKLPRCPSCGVHKLRPSRKLWQDE